MEMTTSWDNEETVLRLTLSGRWDWEELYEAIEVERQQREPSRLSLVIDMRQITHVPSDAVLYLQRGADLSKQVGGKIVVIATSTTVVTMFRLFATIYRSVGDKFLLASSDEEAAKFLGIN